jgi:hypothetical protein
MPKPFPDISLDNVSEKGIDQNPGVQLFGRRFFSEQTTLELLSEMLLVAVSPKRLRNRPQTFTETPFPPPEVLKIPWETPLSYAPKSRLNLKLFAFFGASKLETRHITHRQQLEQLDDSLREHIRVSGDEPDDVIKTLGNLFLGFHGEGLQRTWCAQSFLPMSKSLLAAEVLWNETFAKKNPPDDWHYLLSKYTQYFSVNKHRFLARGGELLYLQLCNALRRDPEEINEWLNKTGYADLLTEDEKNPDKLCYQFNTSFESFLQEVPQTFSQISEFIDRSLDNSETVKFTDYKGEGNERRYTECGWCPEETWQEAYLFAVEISRICKARLGLIDRVELLETACALQVLRTLMWQSARYASNGFLDENPRCKIAVSDPEGESRMVKQISRSTVQAIEKQIFDALRAPEIRENSREDLYPQADKRYGHKLFRTLSKRLRLIVPRRGSGMRFVMNDRILRCLVVSLLPARRISYDSFKNAAEAHYGFVFDERGFCRANQWATGVRTESLEGVSDEWLINMLEESGSLRKLSDSCSLVENRAFAERGEE